jgi:hypothetical protein
MNRLANVFVALCLATGLTACGGGYSGFIIPVESELRPWSAPEADELISDGTPEAGDDEDYEDYEDEEGGAPDPAIVPPPAQPAVK